MSRLAPLALLLVLSLASLALRLYGIGYLLPHSPEPDAQIVGQAQMFRSGDVRQGEVYSTYPHLLARVLSLLPEAHSEAPLDGEHLQEHLDVVARPFLEARILVALLASLLVPLTWLLARRWLGPWESLFAAALVATSLLHVNFSQQARPHAPFASAAALCAIAALRLRERPTLGACALFGLAAALAAGLLHSAVFVLAMGPLALWLRERAGQHLTWAHWLVPLLIVALAGLCSYPFLFHSQALEGSPSGATLAFPHPVDSRWWDGSGFRWNIVNLWRYDPLLVILAPLGLLAMSARSARSRRLPGPWRPVLVLLGFTLPYLIAIGLFRKTYERFLLPLLPFLALLGAGGLHVLAASLARFGWERAARALALVLALCVLVPPAGVAARLVWLRSRPDTLMLAARSIRIRAPDPSASVIALHPALVLPLVEEQQAKWLAVVRSVPLIYPWPAYVDRLRQAGRELSGYGVHVLHEGGRGSLPAFPGPQGAQDFRGKIDLVQARFVVLPAMQNLAWARAIQEALAEPAFHRTGIALSDGSLGSGQQHLYQDQLMRVIVQQSRIWGPPLQIYERRGLGARPPSGAAQR